MGSPLKRAFTYFVFAALALMFAYNVRGFILTARDPYIYSGAFAKPDRIHAGDELHAVYKFDYIRICNSKLKLFVENTDTNEIVFRDEIDGGAAAPGLNRSPVVLVKTEHNWIPGNYVLRLFVAALCSDGAHNYAAPEVTFMIELNP